MKEKNYIRFPDNIFEAEDISVCNEKYKLYLAGIKYNEDRVAMVGDSFATDIIGGNNAGFKTVAVVNGGSNMGITAKKDIEKGRTKFQERLKQENAVPTMVIGHI